MFGTYLSDKLNTFRRDIAHNLSDFLPIKDEEENNIINIMSQPIKLDFNIKRNKKNSLLKNNVIIVSFLLVILSLKIIKNVCHIRNSKAIHM